MGEDTQSLLDNIDLLDEDYPSGLGISFSNLVLQIDDDEVDFVIGLKSER